MNVRLHIQRAYEGDKFVGYRFSIPGNSGCLVWDDQSISGGFRVGDSFAASPGKPIRYVPCELVEPAGPPSGDPESWCDGCLLGLPVDRHGIHRGTGPNDRLMFCTADSYAAIAKPDPAE